MNKLIIAICVLLMAGKSALAEEIATAKEAEAMVAKVVAAIREDKQKTYREITAQDPKWIRYDLYPVVYDLTGKVLAHGANAKMVGKDLIAIRDVDDKPFIKERVELAKAKGKFWQDYKFVDPASHKIEPKQMYCEKLDQTIVCAGIYKR